MTQVATIEFKTHLSCLDQFDPRLSTFPSAVANSSTARSYFQPASQDPITSYCTLQRCEYHLPYVCMYVCNNPLWRSSTLPSLTHHPPTLTSGYIHNKISLSYSSLLNPSIYLSRAMPERDGLGNPSGDPEVLGAHAARLR